MRDRHLKFHEDRDNLTEWDAIPLRNECSRLTTGGEELAWKLVRVRY